MTELEFLDHQQERAVDRVQRALLGGDGTEAPMEALEQATIRHPLLAVGVAAAVAPSSCGRATSAIRAGAKITSARKARRIVEPVSSPKRKRVGMVDPM